MPLGMQVSISRRMYESVDRARERGCEAMQIFSRNPRAWKSKDLSLAEVEELKKRRAEAGIAPLIVHIPYLINLATPDEELYLRSMEAYIADIKRAETLGAEYFVTHMGNHKGKGEEWGLARLAKALERIISATQPELMILLENTAGSGSSLGGKVEHFKRVVESREGSEHLGFCLDTCHAFAAGYDVSTEKGLERTLREVNELIGEERIKVVHVNDSKTGLNSRVDRHEHIGRGKIGLEGMRTIINHPLLKELPFILETPVKSIEDDLRNMATLRSLRRK